MLVDMRAVGFGSRSRRYAMVVTNGVIEQMFVEPDSSAADPDPYGVSSPESVMAYLNQHSS
jgi:peroxiredoxin